MPLADEVPAGPGTGGQYCRHIDEQVECPGLSAVSMYTVKPLLLTRTGPNEVVATPKASPEADFAGVDPLLGVVAVLVPQAAASMSVAVAPSRRTVNVVRDMMTSPVGWLGVTSQWTTCVTRVPCCSSSSPTAGPQTTGACPPY